MKIINITTTILPLIFASAIHASVDGLDDSEQPLVAVFPPRGPGQNVANFRRRLSSNLFEGTDISVLVAKSKSGKSGSKSGVIKASFGSSKGKGKGKGNNGLCEGTSPASTYVESKTKTLTSADLNQEKTIGNQLTKLLSMEIVSDATVNPATSVSCRQLSTDMKKYICMGNVDSGDTLSVLFTFCHE